MYTEFLLTFYFFDIITEESNNINKMLLVDVNKHYWDCSKKAQVYCIGECLPYDNFQFQNIISDKTPAARFNNSKKNIAEQFANIMKANWASFKNPVHSAKIPIQLYNN